MWPILGIAWVLFGLIVLWFTYNWMVEKHGKKLFHRKIENFGDSLPMILSVIVTIASAGLAWPMVFSCFLIAAGGGPREELHPIRFINKPMKYIVKEIQNPRKNV